MPSALRLRPTVRHEPGPVEPPAGAVVHRVRAEPEGEAMRLPVDEFGRICDSPPMPPFPKKRGPKARNPHRAGARRIHARAKVGDRFGVWAVVELLDLDHTRNERVRVRCDGGHERSAYVFNLRAGAADGTRCKACGGFVRSL